MTLSHSSGSFDYKTINENIRNILDVRSQLNNTVQVGMPFVKATATIRGTKEYLNSDDNVGFTLGLHGIPEDVRYENMFSSENGTDPLIGYTYRLDGLTERVYAKNPNTEVYRTAGQILDKQSALLTYPENSSFIRIPPPGITNVTIGRNKNGLISMAQLQISIPTLLQLESLHRTFLIPGVGMILEWGQQFAPYPTNEKYLQKTDITPYMFPWHNRTELNTLMTRLAKRDVGLIEILEKYVYPSNGQYMWMFGRVATFDIKSNSDGSFTCNVKIIGSSEDSWAYSTKNSVIPRRLPGRDGSSQLFCASDTNSVYSYFANTMAGGLNLKTLLDDIRSGKLTKLREWQNHIVYFEQGNQSAGEPLPGTETATKDEKTFADNEDAYFMTWRFFVNVVINDPEHGIKAIFSRAHLSDELVKSIGLLMPYGNGESRDPAIAGLKIVDDPKECFVGANKYLRSTDPSVLVIVNETAVELAKANPQYTIPVKDVDLLESTNESQQFTNATAPFEIAANEYHTDKNNPDRGFLSSGVWLNHKAVVKAMIGADTILRGITNLLNSMNAATENYWQLTLDYIDGEPEKTPQTYTVVDANFKESSTIAVKNFIDKVHVFNKYIRSTSGGEVVGSELIECGIDLSLPKRLFSQIATLGLISPSDAERIQQKEQQTNVQSTDEGDTTFSAKIADPNNSLAEMFGIISLTSKTSTGQNVDLTILGDAQSGNVNGTCGKTSAQLPAGVAGQGYQVNDVNPLEALSTLPSERKKFFDESSTAVNTAACMECEPCLKAEEAKIARGAITSVNRLPITGKTMDILPGLFFQEEAIGGSVSSLLLGEVSAAFNTLGIRGVVSSGHRDKTHPLTLENPKSRHTAGLAIDISKVIKDNRTISVQEPEGKAAIDAVVNLLRSIGYTPVSRERGMDTRKAILWQVTGHTDHIHISLATDAITTTPPTPSPAPETVEVCKDEDYARIGNGNGDVGREICRRCNNHRKVVEQITKTTETSVDTTIRNFPGLRQSLRYVEVFPEMMVASITANANGDRSNAFGASPGSLSIGGDIVLPGIAGLRVGELFWIDRVPAFYKVFGAFQILSLEDTINQEGWKTKIHARFNYLGTVWKRSMTEILK